MANNFNENEPRDKDGKWTDGNANIDPYIKRQIDVAQFKEDLPDIEKQTGLKFKKAETTDSYYNSERAIRLSDHFSKYTEKQNEINGDKDAMDLNYTYYSKNSIIHLINGTDPFAKLKSGDKINHAAEIVGRVEYLSSDFKKGYVEVKKKDGSVVKYDMEKFLSKNNKL